MMFWCLSCDLHYFPLPYGVYLSWSIHTGHSGGIELLMEEALNKKGKTGRKGLRNMEEGTSCSHNHDNLTDRWWEEARMRHEYKLKILILTGFLSGHCRLKEHLGKIRIENDRTWKFVQKSGDLTPHHLLVEYSVVMYKGLIFSIYV